MFFCFVSRRDAAGAPAEEPWLRDQDQSPGPLASTSLFRSSFERRLRSAAFTLKRSQLSGSEEALTPSRFSALTSPLGSFVRRRFAPHCPPATHSRGWGGPLCTFFLSDVLRHVLGRRRRTRAPPQRPGSVSIFIKQQCGCEVWQRSPPPPHPPHHPHQPTMVLVHPAAAGDSGVPGFLPHPP